VKKVLPVLLKDQPKLSLMIAGANPSQKVKELASPNVTVTGWVDDIRECYGQARVFLAPMQTSIGMQNKILEAMAMKIPCITSTMANNAIEAVEGESILLGKTPEEYAAKAIYLLDNPQKAETLASNAFQLVNAKYSWEQVSDYMDQIFT
jgi:glycosyltransferase involved in cell wall biosynthesis